MAGIFKKNDIRGVWNDTLTPEVGFLTGYYFSKLLGSGSKVVIAGDPRLSTPDLIKSVSEGLSHGGVEVQQLGLGPTPLVYFACATNSDIDGGIVVTASHNPIEYNGLKLCDAEGAAYHYNNLYRELEVFVTRNNNIGKLETVDGGMINENKALKQAYYRYLTDAFKFNNPINIIVEVGNGTTGDFIEVLTKLNCRVEAIREKPDGTFPTLLPDPSKDHTYECIKEIMVEKPGIYDLGIAFDGDGDRIGFVSRNGTIIPQDKVIMLFAQEIIKLQENAKIIIDVKISKATQEFIEKLGGEAILSEVGHSWIHERIIETEADFAGELSGHYYFNDRYHGFDDGLYAALRFLEIVDRIKNDGENLDEVIGNLPMYHSSKEYREKISYERQDRILESLKNYTVENNGELVLIDGIRGEFDNGWFIARKSGTEELLSYRVEGVTLKDKEMLLEAIQSIIHTN